MDGCLLVVGSGRWYVYLVVGGASGLRYGWLLVGRLGSIVGRSLVECMVGWPLIVGI